MMRPGLKFIRLVGMKAGEESRARSECLSAEEEELAILTIQLVFLSVHWYSFPLQLKKVFSHFNGCDFNIDFCFTL